MDGGNIEDVLVESSEKSPKMSHDTSENGNLAMYDATEGVGLRYLLCG